MYPKHKHYPDPHLPHVQCRAALRCRLRVRLVGVYQLLLQGLDLAWVRVLQTLIGEIGHQRVERIREGRCKTVREAWGTCPRDLTSPGCGCDR